MHDRKRLKSEAAPLSDEAPCHNRARHAPPGKIAEKVSFLGSDLFSVRMRVMKATGNARRQVHLRALGKAMK